MDACMVGAMEWMMACTAGPGHCRMPLSGLPAQDGQPQIVLSGRVREYVGNNHIHVLSPRIALCPLCRVAFGLWWSF